MSPKLLPLAFLALALAPPGEPLRSAGPRPEIRSTAGPSSSPQTGASPTVDFQAQILPILQARCQPCHFEGGKMYRPLPFDRPETIHKLGEKMFTRIKDPKEQELLRAFLAARGARGSGPLDWRVRPARSRRSGEDSLGNWLSDYEGFAKLVPE